MRIISGQHRGRKLRLPKTRLRPTADRVKEALFSILGSAVVDARVLDLFAGSGSLGLEALSRGARSAVFVEIAAGCTRVLEANVALLTLEDRAEVVRSDAIRVLERAERGGFEVAFADPPYRNGYAERVRDLFLERRFAKILCIEHSTGELSGADDCRRYGDTEISFYECL